MEPPILQEANEILKHYVGRLKAHQKAAILLNALTSEVTIEVSRGFTEREIQVLLPEMSKLSNTSSIETLAVINEFFGLHNLWPIMDNAASNSDLMVHQLERWARKNPRRLARLLRDSWLAAR